ncbi:PKD domain-containing protein [Niabella drilacis]|uniref:PKD domain-containing protein n=1 Tax=Niabella drilacis (strain DSM 25811 / CCM 8410 / CCUG 62505 / LMG 26954 / E90) TaxID=1285928 RepID=A0A1G6ZB40_NIADE|nr:PKD domain-containing protein [Niabella drilacis]SDD98966.1 PKD domain-containing protein [Niabella drilacis]
MHFVYSKQWGRLDFRVWISLIAVTVIALALLGYKVATHVTCPEFHLKTASNINHIQDGPRTYFVNEQVQFFATRNDASLMVTWNFGDKSATRIGTSVTHSFIKEGNYLVTAMVNGSCTESVNIRVIQNSTPITAGGSPDLNRIVSDDVVATGDAMVFNTTAVSSGYNWSINELPEMGQQLTRTAKFIFTKPGTFTVTLKLDQGSSYQKTIQVTDPLGTGSGTSNIPVLPGPAEVGPPPLPADIPDKKPEENKPEEAKPAAPEPAPAAAKVYEQLPEPAIQAMLEELAEGKKNLGDFNNILCNGAGTKVMANNQSTTFAALCNELKEKKGLPLLKRKKRIQSFKVVRDPSAGNCVKIIYITYK